MRQRNTAFRGRLSRGGSLTDAISTHSAQGQLVLNLFDLLAEFERELIRERTLAASAGASPACRKKPDARPAACAMVQGYIL